MKNLFIGMFALAMLASASCSAQRVVTTDSTKQVEVVVIHDDVYYNPWYQNTWQRPYYVRPHHRPNVRPDARYEKRDSRPNDKQYRPGTESTYNRPQMRKGMPGGMNPQMHQGMQNKQPGTMMRQGMQNNRPPQQQMRSNPGATRSTPPIKKSPGIVDEYDLPMEDFIQYQINN